MRTTFKTTWVALALLLALSSCQNLETDVQTPETTSPQKELREVIITASISDASDQTRTSYNETEGKNYWSPGDKIKVFSAGEAAQFRTMCGVCILTARGLPTPSQTVSPARPGSLRPTLMSKWEWLAPSATTWP